MSKRFKKVYIEISNICNLQCTFCPEVGREKKQIAASQLDSYLLQIKDFAERVCFHVMGEPLQHPDFLKFIQMAQSHQIPIEITTNGTLLNETSQQALLNPTVVQVNFSLQSFLDNYPKANPDTYLRNIFSFCKLAQEQRPDLYINFRLWNLGDSESMSAMNEDVFQRIEKEFHVELNRRVDPGFKKSKNIRGRLYLHFDSRFEWPHRNAPMLSDKGTCHGTRSHVAIHADGKVVPCCLDKEADIVLGEMSQSSFKDIVTNSRTENMRQGFEAGKLVESFCQRCTYINRFK